MQIRGEALRWSDVSRISRLQEVVELSTEARSRMAASRAVIEKHLAAGDVVYGVSTGFGKFANVFIEADKRIELQRNLVRSHSAGVGEPFDDATVRAMLLLRANALAKGASGIRPAVVDALLAMLNAGVLPVVPQIGSLGASGDLAPLAHLALVLIGEGFAKFDGKILPGAEALNSAGLQPLELHAKEGLSLLNGTQAMTAIGCLLSADAENLCKIADIAAALSIDATLSSRTPCEDALHQLRPYAGAMACAENVRNLLEGSEILASHAHCKRVQDPYSLRCLTQVHGATRDALKHFQEMLDIEINSATDNPLVMPDGRVLSGGNFHGQPIAIRTDYLALALHELGSISERRVDWIMNPNLTDLPAFLSPREGLHSGYMIAQYTSAALVSENKKLCNPASADSIPVSGNQEDHCSMGLTSARHARMILDNVTTVLAIEILCASQAIHMRKARTGARLIPAVELIWKHVPPLDADRVVSLDIEAVRALLSDGELIRLVERNRGLR